MKRFYYNLLSLFVLVAITICKKFHTRTFQGREVHIDEVPYIVAVINPPMICTGFLVELKWVVTAAHCFDTGLSRPRIAVGTHNINQPSELIAVKSIILHPKYQLNDESISIYDIALVKLAKCVKITKYIQLITIDNKGWPNNTSRRDCYVSGFGIYNKNNLSGKIHGGLVTIGYGKFLDLHKCHVPDSFTDNFYWSYLDKGAGICFGDSGAPLVCDNIAVGVAVGGQPCKSSSLFICEARIIEIYVIINNFSAWIQDKINNLTECDYTSAMRPSSMLTILFVFMFIL